MSLKSVERSSIGIEENLERIFAHLRVLGRNHGALRLAGHGRERVVETIAALELSCPGSLAALYASADGLLLKPGQAFEESVLFPLFTWLPLGEAMDQRKQMMDAGAWHADWLPIFGDAQGDYYAVICNPDSGDFGRVLGVIKGETRQIVEFSGLDVMLATIEASYAEGVFSIVDGTLDADYARMDEIANRLQPGFKRHYAGS